MKKQMKPLLPILLTVVFVLSVGISVRMSYSKYLYSKDVANVSLKVIPASEVLPTQYNLDVSNVHNMTVKAVEAGTTFETNGERFLVLQVYVDEGYVLPETIEIVIAEENYVVSTIQAEENAEEFKWIFEENLLIVSSAIIPAEGCTIFVYAEAISISGETEQVESVPEGTNEVGRAEIDSEEMEENDSGEIEDNVPVESTLGDPAENDENA